MLVIKNIPNLIYEKIGSFYVAIWRDKSGRVYCFPAKDSTGKELKLPVLVQEDLPKYVNSEGIKPSFIYETRLVSRTWDNTEILSLAEVSLDQYFDLATDETIENKKIVAWIKDGLTVNCDNLKDYKDLDPTDELESLPVGYYVLDGYLIELTEDKILCKDGSEFSTLIDQLDFYFTEDCPSSAYKIHDKLRTKLVSKKYASILQNGFIPKYSRHTEILKFLQESLNPLAESSVITLEKSVDLSFEALLLAENEILDNCANRLADSGIKLSWLPEQLDNRIKLSAFKNTLSQALDYYETIDHPVVEKLQSKISELESMVSNQKLLA